MCFGSCAHVCLLVWNVPNVATRSIGFWTSRHDPRKRNLIHPPLSPSPKQVADIIAFAVPAVPPPGASDSSHLDEWGKKVLTFIRAQGMPGGVGLVQGLADVAPKKRAEAKKAAGAAISAQFPDEMKSFGADSGEEWQQVRGGGEVSVFICTLVLLFKKYFGCAKGCAVCRMHANGGVCPGVKPISLILGAYIRYSIPHV